MRCEQVGGGFAVGADDDAVGMEEVLDGGAFAQELGVGDHVEEAAGDAVALDGAADPLVGVDRDGAFFDDDLVAGQGRGRSRRRRLRRRRDRRRRFALRSADGDEDGFAFLDGGVEVGGEAEAAIEVQGEQLGQVAARRWGRRRQRACGCGLRPCQRR